MKEFISEEKRSFGKIYIQLLHAAYIISPYLPDILMFNPGIEKGGIVETGLTSSFLSPSVPKPVIICRCCGRSIEPKWQAGSSRRAGCWLLTCMNESCSLCHYTFSATHYNTLDLSLYYDPAGTSH